MKSNTNSEILIPVKNGEKLFSLRIIALWAFSESAFGGILHALTIPFRGLFIASAAVLFISLIALFGKNNREILKATFIVVLIKAVVSPHSPLTAYLAVSLQGLLGFLFFSTKKFYRLSAFMLGLMVLFLSGIQKIIVLTILFGNTLWESLDIFIKQVSTEVFNIYPPDINYGYLVIAGYVFIHLAAGFFIGLYAGKLPQKINYYKSVIPDSIYQINGEGIPYKEKRKKKRWFLRPTGIFVILLSAGLIIISYLSPQLDDNVVMSGTSNACKIISNYISLVLIACTNRKKTVSEICDEKEITLFKRTGRNNFDVSSV